MLELLDLSIVVFKKHWQQILIAGSLLGLPALAMNQLLVAWMLNEQSLLVSEHLPDALASMRWRHNFHIALLFFVQFQLITLPISIFLGNQIFFQQITTLGIIKKMLSIAFRCVIVLGVFRLGLVVLPFELLVDRSVAFDVPTELFLLGGITAFSMMIRSVRPFAPEILGLELCPLRSTKKTEISYGKRSRSLHRALVGDHMARFSAVICFSLLLELSVLGTFMFLQGVSTGDWQWSSLFDYVLFPLSMWMVGLLMAVFRFLAYLDSRIRLEGWEIELRLRAEAERLHQLRAAPTASPTQLSISDTKQTSDSSAADAAAIQISAGGSS